MSRVTFAIVATAVVLTFALVLLIPAGTVESMMDWAEQATLAWARGMSMLAGDFSG